MSKKKQGIERATTLAQFVAQRRRMLNLSIEELAKSSRFPAKRIEAIESGVEIWLSVTDRAILSKALRVYPADLREVEASPEELWKVEIQDRERQVEELGERILAGEVNLPCPNCGGVLKCTVESAFDHDGLPAEYARAYCPVCPFSLR